MNELILAVGANEWRPAILAIVLALNGCAKQDPKPLHTQPWLAHPKASAASSADASLPITRYVLTEQSRIQLELSSNRSAAHGTLKGVSGELSVVLGALAQSRGQVRAELDSLVTTDDSAESAVWLDRARSALGLADAGPSPANAATAVATFDLTALDEVDPEALEPATASDAGAPFTRRVRASAEGNLLLNGFRVLKRAPLEAEFGFAGDPVVPTRVVIRSRAPLVITLETHEIHLREPARSTKARRSRSTSSPHELRVSVELYATKD